MKWTVVFEVFPAEDSPHFEDYCCASARFTARASSADEAIATASTELAADGWQVASMASVERVDVDDEPASTQHHCDLRRVRRFVLHASQAESSPERPMREACAAFFATMATTGFVVASRDGDLATFEVEEQPFVPMWTSQAHANEWLTTFASGDSVELLTAGALAAKLTTKDDGDTLVALGIDAGVLVTFHPMDVVHRLLVSARRGDSA